MNLTLVKCKTASYFPKTPYGWIANAMYKKKIKGKMSYADKLKIPYVVFLGEDEIAAGMVSCKNMTTGAQPKLPVADAILMMREDLAERNKGKVIVEK